VTDIPIGNVIIDIGNVPQWFIAVAAAALAYKVWRTDNKTTDVLGKIEQVRHETNSMRSALELASRAEGRLQGRKEMRDEAVASRAEAKEVVRTDAIADATTSAAIRAADPDAKVASPKPVAIVTVAVDTPNQSTVADTTKPPNAP